MPGVRLQRTRDAYRTDLDVAMRYLGACVRDRAVGMCLQHGMPLEQAEQVVSDAVSRIALSDDRHGRRRVMGKSKKGGKKKGY